MRDPDRIPRILQVLSAAWMANPDMRLTQLVNNATFIAGNPRQDTFYVEDEVTERGLMELAQGDSDARGT